MRVASVCVRAVASIICGCGLFPVASGCRAAAFTDPVAFEAAAAMAGISITTDNFSPYPLGDISNGRLGPLPRPPGRLPRGPTTLDVRSSGKLN
jgi:hypothetical protein